MTRKERERKKRLEMERAIRSNSISQHWVYATKYIRPWLHELSKRYKDRGEFPPYAVRLLPLYYTEPRDKEVAVLASILINERGNVASRVADFRMMLGDSPYDWLRSRAYTNLGLGNKMDLMTGKCVNRRIAEYFDLLHDNWAERQEKLPMIIKSVFQKQFCYERLNTLRLVLGAPDGLGLDLWATMPPGPQCPLTSDAKTLLVSFFPDYRRYGTPDEAIRLFGFDRDSDFLYAALAWKELCVSKTSQCLRLIKSFQAKYKNGITEARKIVGGSDGLLQELDF